MHLFKFEQTVILFPQIFQMLMSESTLHVHLYFYFLFISPRCSLYIFPYYYIFWIICLLRGYVSNYQWINKVCYYIYDALFSFVQKVHVIIYDGINLTLQKKYNSARYSIFFIRNKKNLNKLDTKCTTISQEKLKRGYLKWNIEAHNEIFEFIYWRMIFFFEY